MNKTPYPHSAVGGPAYLFTAYLWELSFLQTVRRPAPVEPIHVSHELRRLDHLRQRRVTGSWIMMNNRVDKGERRKLQRNTCTALQRTRKVAVA